MVVQGGTGFADGVCENALQGVRSCDFRKKHIHLVTDGNGKRPHDQVRSAEFQCGERVDDGNAQALTHHGTDGHGARGFKQGCAMYFSVLEHRINGGSIRVANRETDESLACKVAWLQSRLAAQAVITWQDSHFIGFQ